MDGSTLKDELSKSVDYATSPDINVRIISKEGKITPAGDFVKKVTDKLELSFSSYSAYQFVKWQIIDSKTQRVFDEDEMNQFFEFDDLYKSTTTIRIKKYIDNITISPKCAERPAVILNSPRYSAEGAYQDSSIRVTFDKPMDESSIYYTGEELIDLGITDTKYLLCDSMMGYLPKSKNISDITLKNKVYGYKTSDDEKSRVFKNISIMGTETSGQYENILNHFQDPRFSTPYTLNISVSVPVIGAEEISGYVLVYILLALFGQDASNLDIPKDCPNAGSNIIVQISKDFHYVEDGVKITLNNSKQWNYHVNSHTDNDAPTIEAFEVYSTNSKDKEIPTSIPATLTYTNIQNIPQITNNKVYAHLKLRDLASGPADKFVYSLTKTYDENYTSCSESGIFDINYTNTRDATAYEYGSSTIPEALEFSNLNENLDKNSDKKLDDGIYNLGFILYDNAYNFSLDTANKGFYFLVDSTPPSTDSLKFTNLIGSKQLKAEWNAPLDFQKAHWSYNGSSFDSTSAKSGEGSKAATIDLSSLEIGKSYPITLDLYDVHGNKSTKSINYIRPYLHTLKLNSQTTSSLNIGWDFHNNATSNDGIVILYGTSSDIKNATYRDYWMKKHTTKSQDITGLSAGTGYYVWLVSYNGTRPSTDDIKNGTVTNINYGNGTIYYTKPNPPASVTEPIINTGDVYIGWNAPSSGNATGYVVTLQSRSVTRNPTTGAAVIRWANKSTNTTTNKSTNTTTIKKPTAGTYRFKIQSYAGDTSNLSDAVYSSTFTIQ